MNVSQDPEQLKPEVKVDLGFFLVLLHCGLIEHDAAAMLDKVDQACHSASLPDLFLYLLVMSAACGLSHSNNESKLLSRV